jgi:omega-3 fatty acid desaturase (delta-15 desaturase)
LSLQLFNRSPGKQGSHFDPKSDLFTPNEGPLVETSNKFQWAFIGFLAGCTAALGPLTMINLYVLPCELPVQCSASDECMQR